MGCLTFTASVCSDPVSITATQASSRMSVDAGIAGDTMVLQAAAFPRMLLNAQVFSAQMQLWSYPVCSVYFASFSDDFNTDFQI